MLSLKEKFSKPQNFWLSAPIIYSLEITTFCDSSCPGCGNVFQHNNGMISPENLKIILNKIKPYAKEIRITGGEPTLHPQFDEIIKMIDSMSVSFHIFSNGRWKEPERIISTLKKCGYFKSFLISLHGTTADSHQKFSSGGGGEKFKETLENIKLAISSGIPVNLNMVLSKSNVDELKEYAELSKRLGANSSVFSRYIGKPADGLSLDAFTLKKAINQIECLMKDKKDIILGNCIPRCFYDSYSSGCLAGISFCTIDPWGNLRPCNHSTLIAGNLLEGGIKTIWGSKKLKEWRQKLPGACYQCKNFHICPGGCKAQAEFEDTEKDPLVREPVKENKNSNIPAGEIEINENLIPAANFIVCKERFGIALISGNQFIPVSAKSEKIIKFIDGKNNLRKIKNQFGEEGLKFIFYLYMQKFLAFGEKG